MQNTAILVWIYGLLILGGGVMGYAVARSKASLISGIGFGLLLLVSGFGVWKGAAGSLLAATVIAVLLVVIFAVRYIKTRKFMPAGMLAILSLVATILFAMTLRGS